MIIYNYIIYGFIHNFWILCVEQIKLGKFLTHNFCKGSNSFVKREFTFQMYITF